MTGPVSVLSSRDARARSLGRVHVRDYRCPGQPRRCAAAGLAGRKTLCGRSSLLAGPAPLRRQEPARRHRRCRLPVAGGDQVDAGLFQVAVRDGAGRCQLQGPDAFRRFHRRHPGVDRRPARPVHVPVSHRRWANGWAVAAGRCRRYWPSRSGTCRRGRRPSCARSRSGRCSAGPSTAVERSAMAGPAHRHRSDPVPGLKLSALRAPSR